ncbi:efflux RND transporter permease subunit [Sphingobacterium multivorum]|uniref:efflux RND transporter permease subunit n=1 Tax=Sphingobacterium multivorum TaxID=28454 RepID=UPI002FD886A7
MLKKFIDRPVLATVISIIFVILGVIGLFRLPQTRFPDIAPPTVQVTGSYPGGNSETVLRSVVTPLEEQINGVEDMEYITSTASNDGTFSVRIVFKAGVNPDQAAVNVQNRVQQATPILPQEVVRMGLTTSKQQNSMIMIFNIYTEDNKKYDELFLQNYVNINLIPQIKRVPGVGQAMVFGSKDYSMRVWLNPQKMASYGLVPQEVIAAISKQSMESAPGKLGEESKAPLEYVIRYKGKKNLPEQYENIIVKNNNVQIVRLKDVARIEFGSISYSGNSQNNGLNTVTIGIFQTSGSNANEIEIGIDKQIEIAQRSFPPGIKIFKLISTKERLDESTAQVRSTLIEAFILVFLVVFLFLQDIRSTIIPAIAVPVAIVGTFFFLLVFGFTINILTLFALVLAIGIVVDDAIVVVEAVHGKMETSNLTGKQATHSAMSEITGAVISITLVMCAVFIPIGFMTGSSGMFYKQFAYTLVIAIVISAINALTLTPALCALLLKNTHAENQDGQTSKTGFSQRFFKAFNAGFENMTNRYVGSLKFLAKKKWISSLLILATIGVAGYLMTSTSKSFVPMEDDNFVVYSLEMPPGTGLDRTTKAVEKIEKLLADIPSIESHTSITGFNMIGNNSSAAYATGFIRLKDKKKRGEMNDIDQIHQVISQKLSSVKEGNAMAFRSPPVDGYGMMNGAELVLQDRAGKSPVELKAMSDSVIAQIMKQPGVQFAYTMFRADYPQMELEVDEDKAAQLGVDVSEMLSSVQTYFAGDQSLNFNRFGKFYRIAVKADGIYRTDKEAFNEIFVKNNLGQMVPVNTLVTLRKVYGPESVTRYNLYNSLTINVVSTPGISNGAIMETLEKNVLTKLPGDYSYEWTGLSLEEKSSGNQTVLILALSLLFVYFLLSAQYESYLLPLAVLLSIPTGMIGSFLGTRAIGLDNNIYVQVGLIMLIGLLAKNAILIVEFALQRRRAGSSLIDSALEGARARLRPILMTSLAFIAGMVPLMFATGGTATGNHSISTGAAMGMLSGVILGVIIIPLLYLVFQYLQEKVSGKKLTDNTVHNTND